jgi:ABC-2 type transport system ATP-binding protein
VEFTCDHVIVMKEGRVAAQGPIATLKGSAGRLYELRVKGNQHGFLDVLRSAGMECHATDEDVMRVFVPAGLAEQQGRAGDQQAIFAHAAKYGVQVRHLRPSVPTLEDVFVEAVGEA